MGFITNHMARKREKERRGDVAQAMTETEQKPLFTGGMLRRLIIPLVIEQFLLMTVGMADTVMVTTAGEAAVSGVSLVDNVNILLMQIFAALSTGGAVVVSQYLGRRDVDRSEEHTSELQSPQ